MHCYSNSKVSYDSAVYDQTHNVEVRQREFAWLDLSGAAPQPKPARRSSVVARGAKVEKLAGGFYNISGGAAGPDGDFYFVDAHRQRIYRWDPASRQLSTVSDFPLDPVNLAVDQGRQSRGRFLRGQRHRLHPEAGRRHRAVEARSRCRPDGEDVLPARQRLALEPRIALAPGGPLRLTRRHHDSARRRGLSQRGDELGRQIEPANPLLRPRASHARADRSTSPTKPISPPGLPP